MKKTYMHKTLYQKGFGLLELAIVLVIIAMLISGIVGGTMIVQTRKLNKIMEDIAQFASGLDQFQTSYNALPGDFAAATEAFNNPITQSNTANGNGNNLIDITAPYNESFLFWQHLAYAALVDLPQLTATNGLSLYTSNANTPGISLPQGPLNHNDGYNIVLSASVPSIFVKNNTIPVVVQYSVVINNVAGNAALTPEEMQKIDSKYDDGNPLTGNIIAFDGINVTTNACVASGGVYNIGSSNPACYFQTALNPVLSQ